MTLRQKIYAKSLKMKRIVVFSHSEGGPNCCSLPNLTVNRFELLNTHFFRINLFYNIGKSSRIFDNQMTNGLRFNSEWQTVWKMPWSTIVRVLMSMRLREALRKGVFQHQNSAFLSIQEKEIIILEVSLEERQEISCSWRRKTMEIYNSESTDCWAWTKNSRDKNHDLQLWT